MAAPEGSLEASMAGLASVEGAVERNSSTCGLTCWDGPGASPHGLVYCTVALLFCSHSGLNSDMQTLGQARLLTGWCPRGQREAQAQACRLPLVLFTGPSACGESGLRPQPLPPFSLVCAPMSWWRASAKGP